jgi:hypothetical protein
MAPKTPERPMKDVIDATILKGAHFAIEVRTQDGSTKKLEFEAMDSKNANQIVSKIKKLKYITSILDKTLDFWKNKEFKKLIYNLFSLSNYNLFGFIVMFIFG